MSLREIIIIKKKRDALALFYRGSVKAWSDGDGDDDDDDDDDKAEADTLCSKTRPRLKSTF